MKNIGIALGIAGFLATTGVAFAQTTTAVAPTVAPAAQQQMMLQVGPGGKVLLRGTVDSVSASSVTVKSWGGEWTVNVATTATVLPKGTALASFKTGDFVGVQGAIDQAANWTVKATLIRDWTARSVTTQQIKANTQAVHQEKSAAPKTIQGTLSNLDATAQTFTLTATNGTAYSVSLASGALLLTNNRATLDFTKVKDGDRVRVYGTVSSSTVSASIVRDVSVK
ncbi:MAG: DUF5666 domain-containing protein [Minisyncoccota bacterium]